MDEWGCVGGGIHDGLPQASCRGSTHLSQPVAPVVVQQPIVLHNTETQSFLCWVGTFSRIVPFQTVAHFYLDVLDSDQVIQDLEGIDFANLEAAISEATAGARDLVAHGIMQNEDVSGQVFHIRDGNGETVATVPFRATLPGRLRD